MTDKIPKARHSIGTRAAVVAALTAIIALLMTTDVAVATRIVQHEQLLGSKLYFATVGGWFFIIFLFVPFVVTKKTKQLATILTGMYAMLTVLALVFRLVVIKQQISNHNITLSGVWSGVGITAGLVSCSMATTASYMLRRSVAEQNPNEVELDMHERGLYNDPDLGMPELNFGEKTDGGSQTPSEPPSRTSSQPPLEQEETRSDQGQLLQQDS
eukprot:TRINITY_DN56738_c1_g1_i1.p1 TRINITY_DN56738_c1_g1~~TRINITY_DN56738_c1_g1_i1.p1  ORF type:complete len:214 (+),score=29.64 TRINITY_DN56738_c1_g1_i1:33-674(+)